MASDVFEGRLVADGNGNLLADSGDRAGDPVAWDEASDSYRFLKPGEPSHNEQHHQNFVGVVVTQHLDEDQPGYAGTPEAPTEGNEHHFGVLEDDPHYEEGATDSEGRVANTRARQHPDKVAARISGHTHQHKMGGDE